MADKARKRREAFKAKELNLLLEGVEANKGLLFDRFKGAHTNKQKSKKWGEIAERMTAVTGTSRSDVEVRKKWQDFVSLTKKKASDLRRQNSLTGARLNTTQPLTDEEERAMAIIGCSTPRGTPEVVDIHAGTQDPSGEQRQEAKEPILHQSTSTAPTSSPVRTTLITAPSTSAVTNSTLSTSSTATASISAFSRQCSQDLVELEREKVSLLKDICGLLREAAERNKTFQEEVITLKKEKLEIAARQLALEEKFRQPPQRSVILPEQQGEGGRGHRSILPAHSRRTGPASADPSGPAVAEGQ